MSSLRELFFAGMADHEASAGKNIPYARLVDDQTVETLDGQLIQTIQVEPFDHTTSDVAVLNHRLMTRKRMWQAIADPSIGIWVTAVRRRIQVALDPLEGPWLAEEIDQAWRDSAADGRYVTQWYVSVVHKGVKPLLGRKARAQRARDGGKARSGAEREALVMLSGKVNQIRQRLNQESVDGGVNRARVLGVADRDGREYSEQMEFFGYLLNGEACPWPVERSMAINESLLRSRIVWQFRRPYTERFQRGNRRTIGGVLAVKEYPATSSVNLFELVLSAGFEAVVTQSFHYIPRTEIRGKMARRQGHAVSTGDDLLEEAAELTQARREMALDGSIFGSYHASVHVWSEDVRVVDEVLGEMESWAADRDVVMVRENLNREPLFWAMLPGNRSYIARKAQVSAGNLAAWADLHGESTGRRDGNRWGQAISQLHTITGAPYFFSWHVDQVGSAFITGPTGRGKTTALMFLLAQSLRHGPKVFMFDYDRGAMGLIRALGGRYYQFKSGVDSGLNPFDRDVETDAKTDPFIRKFLMCLARRPGFELSGEQERHLEEVARRISERDRKDRNMDAVLSWMPHIGDPGDTLADRFKKWGRGGALNWLFGAEEDAFSGADSRLVGIDYTTIVDDPELREPFLRYWFDRISREMSGENDEPFIVVLEEAWRGFRDDWFVSELEGWLMTVRRHNGLVVFATQSPEKILELKIAGPLLQATPTKMFLPDGDATAKVYCEGMQLSARELELVKKGVDGARAALVKQGGRSVVLDLDISPIKRYLPLLSMGADRIAILEKVIAAVGDDPKEWVPTYLSLVEKVEAESES